MNARSNNRRQSTLSTCTFLVLLIAVGFSHAASAGIIQWRLRVPAGEDNPTNIGSYTNTIEFGNGGTNGYDAGMDVVLDTVIVPNERFFVAYVDHTSTKVEYEFTHNLLPGESYTARLSFENNGGGNFAFTPNTIEFLAVDGTFTYDLAIDSDDNGSNDIFRFGHVSIGEIPQWDQLLFQGNDHRNGWFYGELTITKTVPEPTGFAYAGIGLTLLGLCRCLQSARFDAA